MQPPRWFHAVLAICAIVLTLATSAMLLSLTYRLRYTTDPEHGALIDHWRRTYCLTGGCVRFDESTIQDSTAQASPSSAAGDSVVVPGQLQQPPGLDSMLQPRRGPR